MDTYHKTDGSLSIKTHLCPYSMHAPLAADPVLHPVNDFMIMQHLQNQLEFTLNASSFSLAS